MWTAPGHLTHFHAGDPEQAGPSEQSPCRSVQMWLPRRWGVASLNVTAYMENTLGCRGRAIAGQVGRSPQNIWRCNTKQPDVHPMSTKRLCGWREGTRMEGRQALWAPATPLKCHLWGKGHKPWHHQAPGDFLQGFLSLMCDGSVPAAKPFPSLCPVPHSSSIGPNGAGSPFPGPASPQGDVSFPSPWFPTALFQSFFQFPVQCPLCGAESSL